ncbi:hypothetical protein [Aquicoccus sp. SU-CL01552]
MTVLMLLTILNGASALVTEFRTLFALRLLVGGVGSLATRWRHPRRGPR